MICGAASRGHWGATTGGSLLATGMWPLLYTTLFQGLSSCRDNQMISRLRESEPDSSLAEMLGPAISEVALRLNKLAPSLTIIDGYCTAYAASMILMEF